jgi:DNA recombination protein RmuC
MLEGSNYRKQRKADDDSGIPDFTFLLPRDQVLYMDVKFPLAAYMRWLDAPDDVERRRHRDVFLRDVRARVTELTKREYGRAQTAAVDHVLLFVPNESIAAFIHENDPELVDWALGGNVILCSPLNLIALLGVIRQAVDAFAMEQRADQVLEVMGAFNKQWDRYVDATDKVGRSLESATRAYENLTGTRTRTLQRSLDKVESLRTDRGLGVDGELLGDAEVVEMPDRRRELGA